MTKKTILWQWRKAYGKVPCVWRIDKLLGITTSLWQGDEMAKAIWGLNDVSRWFSLTEVRDGLVEMEPREMAKRKYGLALLMSGKGLYVFRMFRWDELFNSWRHLFLDLLFFMREKGRYITLVQHFYCANCVWESLWPLSRFFFRLPVVFSPSCLNDSILWFRSVSDAKCFCILKGDVSKGGSLSLY